MRTSSLVLTTQQVADRLVEQCRKGNYIEAVLELYADDVISFEPEGINAPTRTDGFDAVLAKTVRFGNAIELVHAVHISDPIVSGEHFAVSMHLDVTLTDLGRMPFDELALYQVSEGRIVREQFFYPVPPDLN